jgi:hypothetical protein
VELGAAARGGKVDAQVIATHGEKATDAALDGKIDADAVVMPDGVPAEDTDTRQQQVAAHEPPAPRQNECSARGSIPAAQELLPFPCPIARFQGPIPAMQEPRPAMPSAVLSGQSLERRRSQDAPD